MYASPPQRTRCSWASSPAEDQGLSRVSVVLLDVRRVLRPISGRPRRLGRASRRRRPRRIAHELGAHQSQLALVLQPLRAGHIPPIRYILPCRRGVGPPIMGSTLRAAETERATLGDGTTDTGGNAEQVGGPQSFCSIRASHRPRNLGNLGAGRQRGRTRSAPGEVALGSYEAALSVSNPAAK